MASRAGSRVVVVGAGVGGLVAALELAAAGAAVTVLERSAVPGGKVTTVDIEGHAVDAGPTVLTMRWVFDEVFARAGRALDDEVALERLPVLARHAWPDGRRLDLFADEDASASAIAAAFGRRDADGYLRFRRYARRILETVEGPFLRAQRPTMKDLWVQLGRVGVDALARIDAVRTMRGALASYFRAPELRQLFGRYATYCGGSPLTAPATLNLVAEVEASGVWRVKGGMVELALALERVARDAGVSFLYQTPVRRVARAGRTWRVSVEGGDGIEADAVVINVDASAVSLGLLGEEIRSAARPMARDARSFSAITIALVGQASGPPLAHHNVFFSTDGLAEFRSLANGSFPAEPTVYVCASGQDPARWLLVVNAPANGDEPDRWEKEDVQRCSEAIFRTLNRCGVTVRPHATRTATPRDFAGRFPGTGGALYGPAPRGPFAAMNRPGARTKLPGIYLAGGSVHPGPGVPMAALSGRLAAAALLSDLPSTGRFSRVDTRGGISTG